MRLTVSFASSRFVMQRGAARNSKQQLAQAVATKGLTPSSTDIDALIAFIQRGGIYFPAALKTQTPTSDSSRALNAPTATPTVENFLCSNLVVLDFDNNNPDEPTLSWQQAIEHPYIQQHACLLHESPNSSAEQNRFRVLFILPEKIDDYYTWQLLCKKIAEHFPAQYDVIRNPTWGYKGCRVQFVHHKKRIQLLDKKEFARLAEELSHEGPAKGFKQNTKKTNSPAYNDDNPAEWGHVSFEEAEKMLAFIPEQSDYDTWQSIVFGIANSFEQHEAEQLIETWSPGRDRHYRKLIRRANRQRFTERSAEAKLVTIATVIQQAKQHGYQPPKKLFKKKETDTLLFDHTLQVKRWVSEVNSQIQTIIKDNNKTLLVSRTGNGKSRLVKDLATNFRATNFPGKHKPALLLIAPTTNLAEQQAQEFKDAGAISVTGGESHEIADTYFAFHSFICTTPEMLENYMHHIKRFDLVVIDEIHQCRTIHYRPKALAIFTELFNRATKLLGLTATLTDNIFHQQGWTTVKIDDKRDDKLHIIACPFYGGTNIDNNKSNDLELARMLIEQHLQQNDGLQNDDYEQNNQEQNTAQQKHSQKELHPILVIRLQSKKKILALQDYFHTNGTIDKQHIAVLSSDTKQLPQFQHITNNSRIDNNTRVVLTTSVADIGLNILNNNIQSIAIINPQDYHDVVQFAARFRHINVPVQCWMPLTQQQIQELKTTPTEEKIAGEKTAEGEPITEEQKEHNKKAVASEAIPSLSLLQWKHNNAIGRAEELAAVFNANAQATRKGLLHYKLSPMQEFKDFVRINGFAKDERQQTYIVDELRIAAQLYQQHIRTCRKDTELFFQQMKLLYPFCDIHFNQTIQLQHDQQLMNVAEQHKQQQLDREEQLRTILRDNTENFCINVVSAHIYDRASKQFCREQWGISLPTETTASRELKETMRERYDGNIFALPYALRILKRFLHLRQLLLDVKDAARIVCERHQAVQWHAIVMAIEVLQRQYLLQHAPETLSRKWRHEATILKRITTRLQQQQEVLSTDVHSVMQQTADGQLLYIKKRESAILMRILFGEYKRRLIKSATGEEKKISYYNCRHVLDLGDVLQELGINIENYLYTLHTRMNIGQLAESTKKAGMQAELQAKFLHPEATIAGGRPPHVLGKAVSLHYTLSTFVAGEV